MKALAFTECVNSDQAVHFRQLFGVLKKSSDEKNALPNKIIMQGQTDLKLD